MLDGVRIGADDGFFAARLVDPLRVTHAVSILAGPTPREHRVEVAPRRLGVRGASGRMRRVSSPREVTVLGSTGSIGRQAIEVAQQNPDRLRITGLAAGGGDVARLAEQALRLGVRTVAVARATAAQDLQLAFYAAASQRGWAKGEYALPEILAGPRAAEELAARPADVVLNGITGSIGLRPDAVGARGPAAPSPWRTRSR